MAEEEFEDFGFGDEGDMGFGDTTVGAGFGEEVAPADSATSQDAEQQQQQQQAPQQEPEAPPAQPEQAGPEGAGENKPEEPVQASTAVLDKFGHGSDVRLERSGWLRLLEPRKTLSRRGGPKERWFSLKDGRLSYASSVTAKPIGTFDMADITTVVESPDQPEAFTIVTEKKSLNVISREEADARSWIASLRKAQKSVSSSDNFGSATGSALLF